MDTQFLSTRLFTDPNATELLLALSLSYQDSIHLFTDPALLFGQHTDVNLSLLLMTAQPLKHLEVVMTNGGHAHLKHQHIDSLWSLRSVTLENCVLSAIGEWTSPIWPEALAEISLLRCSVYGYTTFEAVSATSVSLVDCEGLSKPLSFRCPQLDVLDITGSDCRSIGLEDCQKLLTLTVSKSALFSLDVPSSVLVLEAMECKSLFSLDVSENISLVRVQLSGCIMLEVIQLDCCEDLCSLDISGCERLIQLSLEMCGKLEMCVLTEEEPVWEVFVQAADCTMLSHVKGSKNVIDKIQCDNQ